jgi:tol-pal system protein YbgF
MKAARTVTALLLAGGLLLAGCSTLTPAEDPVALKLTDLEARLVRIERVLSNQSLIDLASQVQQLQSQTQELRGQLETLQHDTQSASDRQRELYLDIDQRLQALEQFQARSGAGMSAGMAGAGVQAPGQMSGQASGQTPGQLPGQMLGGTSASSGAAGTGMGPGMGAASAAGATPPGNDQERYQAAFNLLRDAHYEESARAFGEFLMNFPNSPLADNAQYWLAETHYVRRDFEGALPEFQKVIDTYPDSSKIPDALLKVGFCNYELKQMDAARTALQQVTQQYPDTTAARLASQRLERMAQEGG